VKREKQAQAVAKIVHTRFPGSAFQTELFAVIGDLNDQVGSPYLKPLVQDLGLENVVERLPANERWTHWFRGGNSVGQLDYLLASPALSLRISDKPRIERRGLSFKNRSAADGKILPKQTTLITREGEPGTKIDFRFPRLPKVTSKLYASDHCPVFFSIEF